MMMSTTTTETSGRASSSVLLSLRQLDFAAALKAAVPSPSPSSSSSSSFCWGQRIFFLFLLLAVAFAGASAAPTTVKLDFEGVGEVLIGNFYGGGAGGPSNDFGIVFGAAAVGAVDSDAGGAFFTANEPSGNTTVAFIGGSFVTVLGGFTAMSFQYASTSPPSITVFDGPNMTGNVLGTASLPTSGTCAGPDGIPACGDPTGFIGIWKNFTAPFSGVAKSVQFSSFFLDDMMITLVPPPTNPPTKAPTNVPTQAPTSLPTKAPTTRPTKAPATKRPTRYPTNTPANACRKGMKGNMMEGCMMMMKGKGKHKAV